MTILGHDIDADIAQVRHLFGYVGQDTERSAYARLSVRNNLHFFGALRGLSNREVDGRLDLLAGYFDFHEQLDKLFTTLSGGQKQTAVIIRALLYDPPLVYLDEPTKGLDPIVARKIRGFLKRYAREQGKALLLTSHILSEVDELADRVALLHDGIIASSATPAQLKRALGVQSFIELRADALPPGAREEILSSAGVLLGVEQEPGWLCFGIADSLDGSEAIIRVLRAHNVHTELRYRALSLEDAFVFHIGRLQRPGADGAIHAG